jgi:hypothetical protein
LALSTSCGRFLVLNSYFRPSAKATLECGAQRDTRCVAPASALCPRTTSNGLPEQLRCNIQSLDPEGAGCTAGMAIGTDVKASEPIHGKQTDGTDRAGRAWGRTRMVDDIKGAPSFRGMENELQTVILAI